MHIALLTEKYPPDIGGLAVSTERLARLLSAHGHHVHVSVPGQEGLSHSGNLEIQRFRPSKRADDTLADWLQLLTARHLMRPFEILHAYFITQPGFLAAYAGRLLGVPAVVSARGNDLDRAVLDPGRAAHTLFALQKADAVTAVCHDLAAKAKALSGRGDICVIANSVDADAFHPDRPDAALRRSLNLPDRPVIGFVGEARMKKGLSSLLLAFRQIPMADRPALLLVGGARPGNDQEMLTVFQKQNPGSCLVVTPCVKHSDLPSYYNLIDILVLPSTRDGLPNALLEGMACGRAVVATSAGGMPDAVVDGENGLLVPSADPTALSKAIVSLVRDPDARNHLGCAAREAVLRAFTPHRELHQYLELYRQTIERS
jgi:glycosyltransferase involved in cell wall biosynthesis